MKKVRKVISTKDTTTVARAHNQNVDAIEELQHNVAYLLEKLSRKKTHVELLDLEGESKAFHVDEIRSFYESSAGSFFVKIKDRSDEVEVTKQCFEELRKVLVS